MYVCLSSVCVGSFADHRISTRTRISIHYDRLSNLKCTETRSKNYNRLKISVDRRSFKFRHPGEARNITLMQIYMYDLPWNVHIIYLVKFIISRIYARIRYPIRIYHNLRLGRLNSMHRVLLAKGNLFNSVNPFSEWNYILLNRIQLTNWVLLSRDWRVSCIIFTFSKINHARRD